MSEDYTKKAIGALELDNLVSCFAAADAALKTADVKLQGIVTKRLKSGGCVILRGNISDIKIAMETARKAAEPLGKIVHHTVIASPTADADKTIAAMIKQ